MSPKKDFLLFAKVIPVCVSPLQQSRNGLALKAQFILGFFLAIIMLVKPRNRVYNINIVKG